MSARPAPQKKRHHYIPITYLNRFTDRGGRVFAYRKDGPPAPLHHRPREIAFEGYYYSQPLPEGGRDNNRLEDLFSTIEADWPGIVDALAARRDGPANYEAMLVFASLLRVRVPAARDPYELFLAHSVKRTALRLQKAGRLPPMPKGLENLLDKVQVTIDPHQSIWAMSTMLKAMGRLYAAIGFEVVHNETDADFITSDNPVVYFDPDVPEAEMRPYTVQPGAGRIEFLLPLTPRLLLRGRSEIPVLRDGMRLDHVALTSSEEVARINRTVARFGYRFVFAAAAGLDDFVSSHAALSPSIAFDDIPLDQAELMLMRMVFAPRPAKPRWRGPRTEEAEAAGVEGGDPPR